MGNASTYSLVDTGASMQVTSQLNARPAAAARTSTSVAAQAMSPGQGRLATSWVR